MCKHQTHKQTEALPVDSQAGFDMQNLDTDVQDKLLAARLWFWHTMKRCAQLRVCRYCS
jgi:hypothetical protein